MLHFLPLLAIPFCQGEQSAVQTHTHTYARASTHTFCTHGYASTFSSIRTSAAFILFHLSCACVIPAQLLSLFLRPLIQSPRVKNGEKSSMEAEATAAKATVAEEGEKELMESVGKNKRKRQMNAS